MMDFNDISNLMNCFPGSFINQSGEFIAERYANQYFILTDCITKFDLKCKVLEWFSRGAYKTEPSKSQQRNQSLHAFMSEGINKYLGTNFTERDFEVIYTYLGNACDHEKTKEFINSGFDMNIFKK